MSLSTTLGILFLAALLEAGGDALVRSGLGASALPIRWACFAAGALVLFSYGYVVNTPTWDFGRLLGSTSCSSSSSRSSFRGYFLASRRQRAEYCWVVPSS